MHVMFFDIVDPEKFHRVPELLQMLIKSFCAYGLIEFAYQKPVSGKGRIIFISSSV
jgi:hypothetical protein